MIFEVVLPFRGGGGDEELACPLRSLPYPSIELTLAREWCPRGAIDGLLGAILGLPRAASWTMPSEDCLTPARAKAKSAQID